MARKFIQMGYTRARRYTNYKGGRKYNEDGTTQGTRHRSCESEVGRYFQKEMGPNSPG